MKNRKTNSRKEKAFAVSQIISLVLEIFAFSFIFGGMAVLSSGSVSAIDPDKLYRVNDGLVYDGENVIGTTSITTNWVSITGSKITGFTETAVSPSAVSAAPPSDTNEGFTNWNDWPETENLPSVTQSPDATAPSTAYVGTGVPGLVYTDNGNYYYDSDATKSALKVGDKTYQTVNAGNDAMVRIAPGAGDNGADAIIKNIGTADKPIWILAGTSAISSQKFTYNLLPGIESAQMKDVAMGSGWNLLGSLAEGVVWSTAAWTLVKTLTEIGIVPEDMGKPFGQALTAGIMAWKTVTGLLRSIAPETAGDYTGTFWKAGSDRLAWLGKHATTVGVTAGIIVAYLVLARTYEKTKTKSQTIEFQCLSWQAPRGGSDCDKCNNDALRPCSEYRCKALGQTCKLINAGTGSEKCIDSSPNDVTSPGIRPWNAALTSGYQYTSVKPRPPGGAAGVPSGMKITNPQSKEGCLTAFNAFEFGIITTEGTSGTQLQPAQCKIDFNHTADYDSMNYYMGDENLFIENHSQRISLPGTEAMNSTFPEIKNDGNYNLYIRCRDGNGNTNEDEFVVQFCIDKTPDVTSPIIKATSIASGSPVLYQVDNATINVYTNEPANCRWSRKDSSYSNMENNMTCNNNLWEMNAEMLYTCTTTLTAIKDKETNTFYFRCQDTSAQNNTMQQSYQFDLIGTQPLTILEVEPNETLGSSTSTAVVNLSVKTDNGFRNGEATCYYSSTGDEKDYIAMFDTGETNIHSQSLDLAGGDYKYYFKCVDAGGNTASNSTVFSVFIDKFAPEILRIYSLESKLIIQTDEESTCRYSLSSCNFDPTEEGVSSGMPYDDSKVHYAEWAIEQTYYIKCFDEYGNMPDPSDCSMILRPYSLPAEEETD